MAKSLIVDSAGNPYSVANPETSYSRRGGVYNARSGMGGAADKSRATQFQTSVLQNRYFLNNIYAESWAAAKFIDIPVDDMFIRPKRYIGDENDEQIDELERIRVDLRIDNQVANAMKAARLYGTSFLVMVFGNGRDTHTPLDMERIGESYPLRALHVFDRFCVEAEEPTRIIDITDPDFGKAEIYQVYPKDSAGEIFRWRVHKSRMIRFDGRQPLTTFGWTGYYEREWGLSELQHALEEILHDSSAAQAVSHLLQESSISVFNVAGVRNAIVGDTADDEVSPQGYAEAINRDKSIFRSVFLDTEDSYTRTSVNLSGVVDIMNKFAERMAAMADIPQTRFNGTPPSGFSATGEHDMMNYAVHVAARQIRYQNTSGYMLDDALAKMVGLDETPEVEWPSLMEVQTKDRMEEVKMAVEAIHTAYADNAIDEEYYVELLAQYDDVFGTPPPPPEPDPELLLPPGGMGGPPTGNGPPQNQPPAPEE